MGLRFEGETTWDNVWQSWSQREGTREDWQLVAKDKGWQSWEEWRNAWVSNFGAQARKWFRYTIIAPFDTIPNFRIGPTQSWQENFPKSERNKHTFAELVKKVSYEKNEKVQGILKNFPPITEFIGILTANKIIVAIEGHHRATAVAIANQQKNRIHFQSLPTIALTAFEAGEETLLDTMLARGSAKESPK